MTVDRPTPISRGYLKAFSTGRERSKGEAVSAAREAPGDYGLPPCPTEWAFPEGSDVTNPAPSTVLRQEQLHHVS